MENKFDIDAAILWVDGNDINHKNKLIQHLDDQSLINKKVVTNRINQVNEIEYTVRSIIKFAPFIRNIYIITDEQQPDFLKKAETESRYQKVSIIDHKVIFAGYDQYLPVFNSYTIETMMHRIPGLAEHFVYFNDDMLLFRETKPEDFFTKEGLPIIRGQWMRFEEEKISKKLPILLGLKKPKTKGYLGYKRTQDYTAKALGYARKICLNHTPFAMRKSVLEKFYLENQTLFINNIKNKFRHENLVMVQSVVAHLEVENNKKVLHNDYQLVRFDSAKKPLSWIKFRLFINKMNRNKLFLNIQSLDLYAKTKIEYILNWIDKNVS